jgi:hypothetical protein
MLVAHAATEYRAEKLVLLDEVIEHVEPSLERLAPPATVEDRGRLAWLGTHGPNDSSVSVRPLAESEFETAVSHSQSCTGVAASAGDRGRDR